MSIHIRPVQQADAERIYFIMTQEGVMPTIISTPSMRLQDMEKNLNQLGEHQHQFVAESDGIVVGFVGLTRSKGRRNHSASLFLLVDEQKHGIGIGRKLMEKVIDLADNWLMLERLELTVVAGNERAKKLYEHLGFIQEGVHRGTLIQYGTFVDEVSMARIRPGGLITIS
ncbi:GNAT family N-acetyltransferase [Bacillus sp. 2205SS5-2]|uniref:GNAT family N-acetyltransferase n=1 Tax=Bacillus sp. 2205SS5-2 TaxID=3109031 RepID=UPI003003F189